MAKKQAAEVADSLRQSIGHSTTRRMAATIPDAAAARRRSTAIAPTLHGATHSRAIWCSIRTIPMSVSSAVRTQTAIS